MVWRMLVWFVAMNGLWLAAHYYVGRTLIGPMSLGDRTRRRLWVGLWLVAILGPANMAVGRFGFDSFAADTLRWVAFAYMGLFALLLSGSLVRDLLGLNLSVYGRLRRRFLASTEPTDPERRRFLANATNAGLLASSGGLTTWGFRQAVAFPEIVEVDVVIPNLPASFVGYRIVQLSDVHVGPTIRGDFLAAVVQQVNELRADLVALTGDLVDDTVARLGSEMTSLGRLSATDGVFFVTGNHEYYWDAEAWMAEMRRLGLKVLGNAHQIIERDGARLLVAGCHDYRASTMLPAHHSDPVAARAGAPSVDASLLLAHQPHSYHGALDGGYDLMLCGHTHGGQFFPITLLTGLAHPFVEGLHRVGRLQVYVSRGTGYWGPPLRVGTRAEITLLTLRSG